MQDSSPYELPNAVVEGQSVAVTAGKTRRAAKLVRALATSVLSLFGGGLGLVAGVLAGFYGGFAVFGDAGDFTMIFVTPCILAGGSVGAAIGAVACGFLGCAITMNAR